MVVVLDSSMPLGQEMVALVPISGWELNAFCG
jgi:hypothetical protein